MTRGSGSRRRAWLAATALTPLVLAVPTATFLVVGASQPAFADGGAGGAGFGGSGGTDDPTAAGNAGGANSFNGGGGGGAGATGGNGGDGDAAFGGTGGRGGLAGGNPSKDGEQGGQSSFSLTGAAGGGGGGGAHGVVGAGLPTSASTGGNGGNGGAGNAALGSGGGGGAGAYGAVVTGFGLTGTIGVSLTGGNGGNGGDAPSRDGGNAGTGGIGLLFTQTNNTVTIGASVDGGSGGSGGNSGNGVGGRGSNGGAAIVGNSLNLTINQTVYGGGGGNGGSSFRNIGADAGAGGAGISGNSLDVTINGGGSVTGGNGGNGGNGDGGGASSSGGNGGNGGAGIAGNSLNLTVSGNVSGGNGGAAGLGTGGNPNGAIGTGGAGIIGQDLTVVVSGTVAGGVNGDVSARANAITFTSGTNVLELRQGFGFTGDVVDQSGNGTLRFGGGTDTAFDLDGLGTAFQGFSALAKNGTSTWTLTGTSGFGGPTSVDAGTLLVNGSLVNSAFAVNTNGTLGGTGNVGAITVNGGVFAPGDGTPGSQMNVSGNLGFTGAGTYRVFVDPSLVSSAMVTGTATLGGATVNAIFAPGTYMARQYTILTTTGGLTGSFGALTTTGLPAGFDAAVGNQGNDVILSLTAQLGALGVGNLTINQKNVANALNQYFNNGGTLPPEFVTLFGLTGEALRHALDQASGESGASVSSSTFLAWQQFFNLIFDPSAQNRGGFGGASAFASDMQSEAVRLAYAAVTPKGMPVKAAPAAATFEHRWSVWGGGYGGSARTEGNATLGSHDTTSRAYGFAVGADHRLTPDTLIGFALAGGGTSFGLTQGLGGGTSDMFQASVYARQNFGAAYLMGAFGYGFQDFTLKRNVTIAGSDALQADFNAHTLAGRVEAGFRFGSPFAGATPYGAVQVASLDLPSYAERATSGSDVFALSYAGQAVTQTRSELGARFDYALPLRDALLTLRGRAAWAHDYDNERVANAGFLALPGTAFTVNGANPDRDSLLVSAGAELSLRNGFSLAGSFEGEFSGNTESYAGKGALRYRW